MRHYHEDHLDVCHVTHTDPQDGLLPSGAFRFLSREEVDGLWNDAGGEDNNGVFQVLALFRLCRAFTLRGFTHSPLEEWFATTGLAKYFEVYCRSYDQSGRYVGVPEHQDDSVEI